MARRELTVTIDTGRDKGKMFHLTEMAARPAHRWASQVVFAVMNAGIDVDGLGDAGIAGLAALGMKALGKIPFDVAEPLLDQLLECVEHVPSPDKPSVKRRLYAEDIEDAATIFKLQKEVVMLHIEPFTTGASLTTA